MTDLEKITKQKEIADEISKKADQVEELLLRAKKAASIREDAKHKGDVVEWIKQDKIITGIYIIANEIQKEAIDLRNYYVTELM